MADKQSRVEEFSKKIKEIRIQKNITLRMLGEKTGLSHSYLSQIENGHKGTPSEDTLIKLSKGLDISLKTMSELSGRKLTQADPLSIYSTQELVDELIKREKIKVKYVLEV